LAESHGPCGACICHQRKAAALGGVRADIAASESDSINSVEHREGKAIGGQSYPRHLRIALGSEAELQTQIELAHRLKMLEQKEASRLLEQTSEVGRMLIALLNSLPRD
jgi:four helix bundle protein